MLSKSTKFFLVIVLISAVVLSSACKASENYDEKEREFNLLYLEIVNKVDYTDTQGSIKAIQTSENEAKIDQLKAMLDSMERYLKKEKEGAYEVYLEEYKGLVFLFELRKEWGEMSIDDRSRAYTEIGIIASARRNKTNQ